MTLEDLVRDYLAEQEQKLLKPATLKNYGQRLGLFQRFLGSQKPTREITLADMGQFFQSLNQRYLSNAGPLRTIKNCLRWGVQNGFLSRDPGRLLAIPRRAAGQPWVPSVEQMEQFLAAPPPTVIGERNRLVLELLYGTGLRRSEACFVDLADLDLKDGTIRVVQGKGAKDRSVILGPNLQQKLHDYLQRIRPALKAERGCPALLLTRDGNRLDSYSIYHFTCLYARTIKLPIAPHTLRRAYGCHLLQGGAAIHEVQALLGHERAETTVAYTQISLSETVATYCRCHPRARRPRREACR